MAQYTGTHTLSNQFQWLKLSLRRNQISDWLWLCVKVSIDPTKNSYLIICKPNNNKKMQNDINKTKKTHAVFLPFSIASDWLTFFFDWIRIQITAYSSSSNKWSLQWYGQLVLCLQKIAILWLTCVSVCVSNGIIAIKLIKWNGAHVWWFQRTNVIHSHTVKVFSLFLDTLLISWNCQNDHFTLRIHTLFPTSEQKRYPFTFTY